MLILFLLISGLIGVKLVEYLRFGTNVNHARVIAVAFLSAVIISCALTYVHSLVSPQMHVGETGTVVSLIMLYALSFLFGASIGFSMPAPRNAAS